MTPEVVRKLYGEAAATTEGQMHLAGEAQTNPRDAFQLWQRLIEVSSQDEQVALIFRTLLDSVLIDHISDRMLRDDEYALVISRRIAGLIESMMPAVQLGYTRTA